MISVSPILDGDLRDVTLFMQCHLNSAIGHEVWMAAFRQDWMADKPNNGFVLRDGEEVVGVLGALYSRQLIEGEVHQFCNLTSLVLLPAYRGRALDLLARCLGQPGFNFTNLTPNPAVERICLMLKFRQISRGEYVFPLLPLPSPGGLVRGAGDAGFEAILSPEDARCYADHRAFPWLHVLAFGRGGKSGLAFYKRSEVSGRLKVPAARFLHVSNPALFLEMIRPVGAYLAFHQGILAGRIEQRLLPASPPFAVKRADTQLRLYRGRPLSDAAIPNLYSELVALPI